MRIDEVNVQFKQGLDSVRNQFGQVELWCRELLWENELLNRMLLEWGGEILWEKLFQAYVEYYGENSGRVILNKAEELLEVDKANLAIIGLNQLLSNPSAEEPFVADYTLFKSIFDRAFATEIADLNELNLLYMKFFSWMREAEASPYRIFGVEYLQQNHAKLQKITADTNAPEVILSYLQTQVIYGLYYPVRDQMEYLLEKEWPFLDPMLDEAQFSRFLWIAYYVSMDDILLEASKDSSSYLNQSEHSPAIRLYMQYCELKMSQYDTTKIYEIEKIMSDVDLFSEREKEKMWEELYKFLERCRTRVTIAATEVSQLSRDYPIARELWQIKNKTESCPHCPKQQLDKNQFLVEGYLNHSDQVQKRTVRELPFCNQCQRTYIHGGMVQLLNNDLKPYRCRVTLDPVEYPPDRNKLVSNPPVPTVLNSKSPVAATSSSLFVWPSTYAAESEGHSTNKEGNFREETDLHRLGYRITGLNRVQRWDILVRKALPSMTLKEIVYTIARNVRLRKSQVGGSSKFKYAITEWEHDLKRLKQEYYKSNFSWPQY